MRISDAGAETNSVWTRGFPGFQANYTQVPNQVFQIPGLGGRERWTFAALAYLTVGRSTQRKGAARGAEKFGWHPIAAGELARYLGLASRTGVKLRMQALAKQGYVEMTRGADLRAGSAVAATVGTSALAVEVGTLPQYRLPWAKDQSKYIPTSLDQGWSLMANTQVPDALFELHNLTSMERCALLAVCYFTVGQAHIRPESGDLYGFWPISYHQLEGILGLQDRKEIRKMMQRLAAGGFIELEPGLHLGGGEWASPKYRLRWAHLGEIEGAGGMEYTPGGSKDTHGGTIGTLGGVADTHGGIADTRGGTKDTVGGLRDTPRGSGIHPEAELKVIEDVEDGDEVPLEEIPPEESPEEFLPDLQEERKRFERNASGLDRKEFDARDEAVVLMGSMGCYSNREDMDEMALSLNMTFSDMACVLRGMVDAAQSRNPKRQSAARRHFELFRDGRLFSKQMITWREEGERVERFDKAKREAAKEGRPEEWDQVTGPQRMNPRLQVAFGKWKRKKKDFELGRSSQENVSLAYKEMVSVAEDCIGWVTLQDIDNQLQAQLQESLAKSNLQIETCPPLVLNRIKSSIRNRLILKEVDLPVAENEVW